MEEVAIKKGPSTGVIIGIVVAIVIIVIIIALLWWLFSSKTGAVLIPVQQPATAAVQPVIVQPQPTVVQPVVAGSRRPTATTGASRRREGATYRQVLGRERGA